MAKRLVQELKEVAIQVGLVSWEEFVQMVLKKFSDLIVQGLNELGLCWVVGLLVDLVAMFPLFASQVVELFQKTSDPSPA